MKNYFWLVGAMVLALSLGLTVQVVAQADHESVSVLISFTDMPGQAEEAMVLAFGGEIKQSFTLVPVIAADIPQAAMRGLSRHPMVTTVELDGQFKVPESQAHSDTELTNTWGVERIGAGQAHHEGYIGAGARVAVLDTGLAVDHSDLSYDPNCSASFVPDQTINDGHGHGTHVAGTIAALADGVGVVGVGPDVTICVLKVLGDEGGGSFSYVIAALEYLVDYNQANPEAQVLVTNNSYGSRTNPGSIVESTFEAAASAGILHVAAAGNDGNVRGNGNNVIYPARYDSVIAVAAINQDDQRAGWSSTGPSVELAAPGVSILSTWPDSGSQTNPQPVLKCDQEGNNCAWYKEASGTSMASPHVAGGAALLLATGQTTALEARSILFATADWLGDERHYGAGLVNVWAAILGIDDEPDDKDDEDDEEEEEDHCPPGWQRQGRC